MKKTEPNAYERIRQGMIDNEKRIWRYITKDGYYSYNISHRGVPTMNTFHALDRLEDRGLIKWDKRRSGYVKTGKRYFFPKKINKAKERGE